MITEDTIVKILGPNRMPRLGKKEPWPDIGEWQSVGGTLVPCSNGLHMCSIRYAHWWLIGAAYAEVYIAEYDTTTDYIVRNFSASDASTIVARRARLVKKLHYSLTDFLAWAEGIEESWSWSTALLRYLQEYNHS